MKGNSWSAGLSVTGDGSGVVAHAGSVGMRLLVDRTGLTGEVSKALKRRGFAPAHDRGRVLVDVAVMLADGGEAIADIDVLRHQAAAHRKHLLVRADGWRYQAFATNTATGQLAFLEARHRAHARVEDRIRHAKDTGLGRFPSREFKINQAWLAATAMAADLVAWLRLLGLDGDLAKAEPKALRYRLLHVPARLTHGGRRRRLRIPATWPWANDIVNVFAKIAAIPLLARPTVHQPPEEPGEPHPAAPAGPPAYPPSGSPRHQANATTTATS